MKVALVHDWLTGTRGGEKVLRELALLFPDAALFTLFHFPGSVPPEIERLDIRTTALARLTSDGQDYRKLLPLFFLAAETWDLRGFDLVLSSSHCVAKNARRDPGAFHACYAHTPVRYLHDQFETYLRDRGRATRAAARAVRAPLAAWDVATARRVDAFLANSSHVAARIERLYGRRARIVHPPVDTELFTPPAAGGARRGFLVVSALAPYKRIDDAIRAANTLRAPLTIAGFGPEEARLRAIAGDTIRFAGTVDAAELVRLYRSAEAVLMPGEEDFGIAPLEAQACGTPVVALGRGGALETVVDGETGILHAEPGVAPLLAALERLKATTFDPRRLADNASRFARATFAGRFVSSLSDALREGGRDDLAASVSSRLRNAAPRPRWSEVATIPRRVPNR